MKQDIKISTENGNFKFRVGGIIIIDNKVLGVQICDNGFYCLPGGHVELGCDTKEATLRELEEEVGCPFEIVNLKAVIENFFKSKNDKFFHEMGFYYIAKPIDVNQVRLEDYVIIEHDKDEDVKLEFKWISLDEIKDIDFRPSFIKEELSKKDFSFKHIIVKEV
jgi:8-oxo-dGTP pyrophosphatase MutT (NUDIX family)